ncbi:MAG: SsrA-binding protein SmpB [Deltaproteobacteria bacterium]|nr:SsrA-binding protein SmpB [Deltaproteobacteria bacterium]
MADDTKTSADKTVATNRKARHDFEIEETWEAGLVLLGSEVKSLRDGAVTIGDGYVADFGDELFLVNVHINEYPQANLHNHEPLRRRKLLLKRNEIEDITRLLHEKGRTCIPLRFYFKKGRCKVELGAAVGKKLHDKRADLKSKDARREIDRALKGRGGHDE